MEYVFEKYRVNGKDFLVFDTNKNNYELSQEKIRRICKHHFGVGISGVIMGPYLKNDAIAVRMFDNDGSEETSNPDAIVVFDQCLKDHVYVSNSNYKLDTLGGPVEVNETQSTCDAKCQAKQTGKIITADHFIDWL